MQNGNACNIHAPRLEIDVCVAKRGHANDIQTFFWRGLDCWWHEKAVISNDAPTFLRPNGLRLPSMCEFAWDVLTFKYKSPTESNYCRPQRCRETYMLTNNRTDWKHPSVSVGFQSYGPHHVGDVEMYMVNGSVASLMILYGACQFTRGMFINRQCQIDGQSLISPFGALCTSFFVQKEHRSMMRLHDETTTFIIPTRLYFWPCAFAQHFGMSNPWSGFDLRIATAFRSGSNFLNNDGSPSHRWRRPLLTIWRKLTLLITLNVVPKNQPSSYFSKFVSPPKIHHYTLNILTHHIRKHFRSLVRCLSAFFHFPPWFIHAFLHPLH